jgi:hypothetical protein
METLKINSKKGDLEIKWSDKNKLAHYAAIQAGCYFSDLRDVDWESLNRFIPLHDKYFLGWNQRRWYERENMGVFDISDNAKIVDIGCGVSIVDLFLYSYLPNSTLYLIDKDDKWPSRLKPVDVSYTPNHPHYNSWDIVRDAINTSGFDKVRFKMLSPEDNLPEQTDLIMSSFSWCFHYPKETYWEKVRNSLKSRGKLFLDVRLLKDRDVIGEISEEFKSYPTLLPISELPDYLDNPPEVESDKTGYRCLWINNS